MADSTDSLRYSLDSPVAKNRLLSREFVITPTSQEFYQRFILGLNMHDSSGSLLIPNSRSMTEKSVMQSFIEDPNQQMITKLAYFNRELLEERMRCQVMQHLKQTLEDKVTDLEQQNIEQNKRIKILEEEGRKAGIKAWLLQKENILLKKQITSRDIENNPMRANKLDLNTLLKRGESSVHCKAKQAMESSLTTRPQSPAGSLRQNTPNKSDKLGNSQFSLMTSSSRTVLQSKSDCKQTRKIIQDLLKGSCRKR